MSGASGPALPVAGRSVWVGTAEVVACTCAWLNRPRRVTVRNERGADIRLAFTLGCAIVCLHQIRR